MYRDYNCGELSVNNVNETVKLAGWVQKIRNLGSMQFVDLRDEHGITQIVISSEKLKEKMNGVYSETVLAVEGDVVERSNKNLKMKTGEIELLQLKLRFSVNVKVNFLLKSIQKRLIEKVLEKI